MITALDTNVVVALWTVDDVLNLKAQRMLDESRSQGGLVISGVVYAELLAEPKRTEAFVDGGPRFSDEFTTCRLRRRQRPKSMGPGFYKAHRP